MPVLNCAQTDLSPYVASTDQPWNLARVAHLYRRMGYGADVATRAAALDASATALVDTLIDAAIAAPALQAPEWADWDYTDYPSDQFFEVREEHYREWIGEVLTDLRAHPLRVKLQLFWHNHFVTESVAYDCPAYLYEYATLLRQHALGNFKTFVREIGLCNAMLIYLNGYENSKHAPNENYARELYELFTLGADNNYTQQDIEETARALTGYTGRSVFCGPINYHSFDHDTGDKTIFGDTANHDYDSVIDLLFEVRATEISEFICAKVYRHFVHPEVDAAIVAELAATFRQQDWELEPVFRQLFRSAHFFDAAVLHTRIADPMEFMYTLAHEMGVADDVFSIDEQYGNLYFMGMTLFDPPNVAGWPGNRSWISTSLLTARWRVASFLLLRAYDMDQATFLNLAVELVGDVTESDPAVVATAIVDYFIPGGLTDPVQYERAVTVFKGDVPEYYYNTNQWNLAFEYAPLQVALLVNHIAQMPEYPLL